ncbi:hypothetical protein [Aestuariivirga sp.]|uniref:hypothetical protein n=1 Tax=Aestuariivirga sp. TaxID=2650926 RepID=UPI0025C05447|nr:hypothetical protein [Aestuariivirga sp.]MCA3554746.1 hypothetical protein [Aestuariivirga sp.]
MGSFGGRSLGRGAARNGLASGLVRPAGLPLPAAGFALPAAGFVLLAGGFVLSAAGFALLAVGFALGAAAFLVAGRLLPAADFFAAGFLAADFLAGAFSGLVLGSGYVSAWMRAACLRGERLN